MKIFWKIVGGVVAVIVIVVIALNLYFTNERLKKTVMPYLNEAIDRPIKVESMSLSFFTTFPQPGVEMKHLIVFGKAKKDTLLSLDRLVLGLEIFSLFGDEIEISELVFENPRFTYLVYPDGSTNIDFLFEETDSTQKEGYTINIPYFEVRNGYFGYRDFTSATKLSFDNVDGDLSLRYADIIETKADLEIGGFSATIDSVHYVDDIPLSLNEKSTFNSQKEIIQLKESSMSIRGLELDLSGSISNWSDTLNVNLQFTSASDNFGALLKLVPKSYSDYTEELTTKGSLTLNGSIKGKIGSNHTPSFNVVIQVENGYIKDPDLPKPIKNITISARATNELITVKSLNAEAGSNYISGSGKLTDPLAENRSFNADFTAQIDLSTIQNFYDLSQMGIEQLGGQLDVDAIASGNIDQPEKIDFEGHAVLADGLIKYEEVPEAITNINIKARGSQELLTIESLHAQAAQNSFSAEGQIKNVLAENARRINMDANLRFDLSTLDNFYPVDEDTLKLDGLLTARASLSGSARQIEEAVESGTVKLQNGMIDYYKWESPLRNITLVSVLEGDKMIITEADVTSGESKVAIKGIVNDYLSESRSVRLSTEGNIELHQLTQYYELAPDIKKLSGNANFNLTVQGSFDQPAELEFSGQMTASNVQMAGKALVQPVKNLRGTFSLTPTRATLDTLSFNIGSSDIHVSGSLAHYMQYLKPKEKRSFTPALTGRFYSRYLNVDEFMAEDTTGTFALDLPHLNSTVQAQIDRMIVFGVTMRNLNGRISTTPTTINLREAYAELFEGIATGTLLWNIPEKPPSTLSFNGSLDSLRIGAFFKQYPVLGSDSRLYKYISGTFHSQADYRTKISAALSPKIPTTEMTASFGMSAARINNHPLQQKLAGFLNIPEIKNAIIDNWESSVSIDNSILHIKNLSITSGDIGIEINGTQHLITDEINFNVSVQLPKRFKQTIASVITSRVANGLTRNDGTLLIPLKVTGTYKNIHIEPDQRVIEPLVKDFLKDKAGNVLQNIFGRDKKKADSAKTDTTLN